MKNVENINIDQKNNKKMKQIQQNNDNEGDSLNELNYHKLQIENAKKDNEIIKLREEIQQFKKCGFDTSSSFPWPTEFKNRWDTLVHTMIMDNFDTINTNYILLMRTLNIIVKSIYDISKNEIIFNIKKRDIFESTVKKAIKRKKDNNQRFKTRIILS